MNAVIVHGYGASPAHHWFPWLARELEAAGRSASVIELPAPRNPDACEWRDTVATHLDRAPPGAVVIAHGLGCLPVMEYAAGPCRTTGLVVLVAPFREHLPELPELNGFVDAFGGPPGLVPDAVVVLSDDDPVVPEAFSGRVAREIGARIAMTPGSGHFTAEDGSTELPVVRELALGIRSAAG